MSYKTIRFQSFDITRGLQPNKSNFSLEVVQSQDSNNITSGIQQGQAPRYGMAPLPGHSHTDGTNTVPVGLMQSENNTGSNHYKKRNRVLGLLPVTLGTFTDISSKKVHYVWLVADSDNYLHFVFAGDLSGGKYRHINDIAAGLQPKIQDLFSSPLSYLDPAFWHFPLRDSTALTDLNNYLTVSSALEACSVASLTVSGKEVPQQWVAGRVITVGDATHTALPNFCKPDTGVSTDHYMGLPSFFNTRNFKDSVRQISFYNINASGGLEAEYDYNVSPDSSVFAASFDQDNTTANIGSGIGTGTKVNRLDAVAPVYANVKTVLYNDPQCTTNCGYTALAAAPGKAVMCIVQDWQRNHDGTLNQFIDPCNPVFVPISRTTLTQAAATVYSEKNIGVATCWAKWPNFDDATPLAKDSVAARDGITHVTLGEADTGILLKDSVYEFAFSIYDKQLNIESNVGMPAKILTDSDDFVRISLFRDGQTAGQYRQKNGFGYASNVPFPLKFNADATPSNTPLNYLEYRVYYRQAGSYEWLPALVIDAAKYWNYPNHLELWACEGSIASLPGGQPGAFNDYSALPKDVYTDVKVFQNRMFWLSPQNLVFSTRNNVFGYPLRNSVPCPNGEFRGFIIHYYYGQAAQGGRVVVFGSKETYSGTFTGNQITQPIQISADTVATFPLDGSDFVLDTRTTVTAFSSRSAIVAEGELYFWGPTGIYYDNGVNIPEKISGGQEPDILSIYDPNKTEEIHAQYLEETKEIIWFYTEKGDTSGTTKGLVYNPVTEQFFYVSFDAKIDWSQKVPIDKTNATRDTNGTRNLIGLRESSSTSIQRAVFFDYRNRSGDFTPGHELMVKQTTLPGGGLVRLYLAGGYLASAYNAITVGSKLCVQQGADYSAQSTVTDFIGQISAKGGTFPNQYLDIVLPSELTTYFAGSLATDRYFPVYETVNNGIDYVFESNFWAASGMNQFFRFMFLHLLFKVDLLPSENTIPPGKGLQTIDVSYKTPISKEYLTNTLTFEDNSAGNFQVYSQLKTMNQAAEGQGIRIKLSGTHLGSEWVLQYIAVDALPLDGDNLQHFEG